jgi:RNA polymerase sigma-32 factor
MLARRYERVGQQLLDLVQEGNIGLLEAVRNFDPHRGVRFPSYAAWWIRAYLMRYLMNNWRMVKLGTTQAQRKLFFNLQREKERLEAIGLDPSPRRLADRLAVKETEVVEMEHRMAARDLSIDTPLNNQDADGRAVLDSLPAPRTTVEEQVATVEHRRLVKGKIAAFARRLRGRDFVIFTDRLLAEEPCALQDLGDRYGVSRERIRQVESRLKAKFKAYLVRECNGALTYARDRPTRLVIAPQGKEMQATTEALTTSR